MRRRVIGLAVVVLLLVLLAVGAVLLSNPTHPLDRAHYNRLALGMTEAEVQDVVDGPPRRTIRGTVLMAPIAENGASPGETPVGGKSRVWASNQGQIDVVFDANGRLQSKRYSVPNDDWLAKFNGWLGR